MFIAEDAGLPALDGGHLEPADCRKEVSSSWTYGRPAPRCTVRRAGGLPVSPRALPRGHRRRRPSLRMHYLDEGPRDGSPILLHGEPTWSYLYRTMIGPLAAAGAPGAGTGSDRFRPLRQAHPDHRLHLSAPRRLGHPWMKTLDLQDITVVVQDWGSLIGLRIAAENPDRFAKLFIANGFLPTADRSVPAAFQGDLAGFAKYSPLFSAGGGSSGPGRWAKLSSAVRAGYDAPFPDRRYLAGAGPSATGAHLAGRSRRPGQPCGLGGAGRLDQTPHCACSVTGTRSRQGRRSADRPHPGRGGPAARPHHRRPLHPGEDAGPRTRRRLAGPGTPQGRCKTGTMIDYHLDPDTSILTLRPESALTKTISPKWRRRWTRRSNSTAIWPV